MYFITYHFIYHSFFHKTFERKVLFLSGQNKAAVSGKI